MKVRELIDILAHMNPEAPVLLGEKVMLLKAYCTITEPIKGQDSNKPLFNKEPEWTDSHRARPLCSAVLLEGVEYHDWRNK